MQGGSNRVTFFTSELLFIIAEPKFPSFFKIDNGMVSYAHVLPSNPGIRTPIKALLTGEMP